MIDKIFWADNDLDAQKVMYRERRIPTEVYHGVPSGWRAGEIRREHSKMKGTFELDGPEATETGAPSFMIHRYDWLQYRATLYRVGFGVRAGDLACVEIAIRFIELHHIGSYSGYVRARLARSLKSASLDDAQKRRLDRHFSGLILENEKTDEFREYARLWSRFITPERHAALLLNLKDQPDGEARAEWLTAILRIHNGADDASHRY